MKKLFLLAVLAISFSSHAKFLTYKCLYHQSPTIYDQYLEVTLDVEKNEVLDFRTYQEFEVNDPESHNVWSQWFKYSSEITERMATINGVRNGAVLEINRATLYYKYKNGKSDWSGRCETK